VKRIVQESKTRPNNADLVFERVSEVVHAAAALAGASIDEIAGLRADLLRLT
jgi:hypothetical protein